MGDSSIESSGAFGIPKWMMRKGMRYEIDDFIVSPPSNEDGGFFHLRYGRCPSPRQRPSSHDCANQGVAMTVEVRDGDAVITGVCSPSSSDSNSPSTTLTISPGVLSSETTPVATPDATADKVVPFIVLPMKFGDSRGSDKDDTDIKDAKSTYSDAGISEQDFISTGPFSIDNDLQHISSESASLSLEKSSITNEKKQRKISLVERVQEISLESDSLSFEDSYNRDETKHRKNNFVERAQQAPLESDSLSPESSSTKDEKKQRKISLVERVQQIPLEAEAFSPESSLTTNEKKHRKISLVERVQQIPLEAEHLPSESTPATSDTRRRKISFVERFQMIPFTADQEGNNLSAQNTTPRTSPLVTPQGTPPLQRKPPGTTMDKGNRSGVHNYFFTRPFQSSEQEFSTVPEMSSKADEVSLSSASSLRAHQMEEGTNLAQSLDPSNKAILGKRRPRPKPSTLREMNFWAPTSM